MNAKYLDVIENKAYLQFKKDEAYDSINQLMILYKTYGPHIRKESRALLMSTLEGSKLSLDEFFDQRIAVFENFI